MVVDVLRRKSNRQIRHADDNRYIAKKTESNTTRRRKSVAAKYPRHTQVHFNWWTFAFLLKILKLPPIKIRGARHAHLRLAGDLADEKFRSASVYTS